MIDLNEIIRMAREAQHDDFRAGGEHWFSMEAKDLERFAHAAYAAGAAAEREACLAECRFGRSSADIEHAIRARGEK